MTWNEITVFPNPSAGNFSMQLSSTLQHTELSFVSCDLQGRIVQHILSTNQPLVSTELSQPGVYMLQVLSGKQIMGFKKIIVLK